ncbi:MULTISPECIES: iron-sulfur cluster biosynthesis transcriptional regulator SufR [Trichocoleus]|uniref:Iron-sulfur cluster biosynthesis transcriptional regulator SufR n=1 Tax=Trichocoleus desertorum GB2-A4 TaxID=2933944 RepID=A0ABV0J4M2_9CYAN|nr:iron-sulfur cluster biosynthesis transcriptional regulator SufR [Trichocoleus sp. FACHB-46]MBD1862065.1 iron-sulfur cluster biosynthesis transcriptional regulator SufR [Trichocoleus sp. FACHB-46]
MATTQQPSTKQDILHHLLKQGQATAQELAEHLKLSPQAIRRHLKDLEAEGLILHEVVHVSMGRPNHVYKLSRQGRDRFPDRYEEFALSLLDTLTETVGREQVGVLLQKQWERKAAEYRDRVGSGSLQERVANLVELRRAEGYMAEWHSVAATEAQSVSTQSDQAERYVVTEYNCAISHIAESFPSVCGHELEMFAAALPGCTVERTHWIVNGEHRCGYLIQTKAAVGN